MLGVPAGSRRLAAGWLIGTALAVLALSHVPAGAASTGTPTAAVSGAEALALPAVQRLQPAGAELTPAGAALPATLVLTLLAGLVLPVLVEPVRPVRRVPRPRPARGPPVAPR